MAVIKPTLGRMVWYTPHYLDGSICPSNNGKCSAQIVHVHDDTLVNLVVHDANGRHFPRTSVHLVQDDGPKPKQGGYCEWMPFQKGQAQKTEEAEAVARSAREGFTGK